MGTVFRKSLVADAITPVGAYAALRSKSEDGAFLLESVVAGERWGRYSILGYRPRTQVWIHGEPGIDPFSKLAELTRAPGADEGDTASLFAQARVGALAYDMVHYATKVEPWPALDQPIA